jgi:CDP-glycerol glycerophosphotransferase (TagB/SpsB family)
VEVYLGHGVWGLKRVERRDTRSRPSFDFGVATSPDEAELKHRVIGGTFLPTGLPKHDTLVTATPPVEKQEATVLYAPTWRDWLQYKASDRAIDLQLSGIAALASALPPKDIFGRDLKVVYLVHRNIRGIVEKAAAACDQAGFSLKVSNKADVGQLLREADYLVTDYSAVLWDYIVQGKPAARFLFDAEVYQKLTGGYDWMETLTDSISFRDPHALATFLFGKNARAAALTLAEQTMPLADGRACERVELALSRLIAERMKKG